MTSWEWLVLLALVVILVCGIYLWRLAVRIDRLHRRVILTRGTLGKALVRRASDSLQLADSGLLAEDSAQELAEAARRSLAAVELPVVSDGIEDESTATDVYEDRRYLIESALSRALARSFGPEARATLAKEPLGHAMAEDLEATCYRVRVSRTLHNQNVTLVRDLRSRPVVRLFHLAGHAPMPQYVDLDDGE